MEEMIARWIRETTIEMDKAIQNHNLYKAYEMKRLSIALKVMRDKFLNPAS